MPMPSFYHGSKILKNEHIIINIFSHSTATLFSARCEPIYIYRLAPCTNGDCVWHCTNDYIYKQRLTTKNLYQSSPGYGESFEALQYLYHPEGLAKEIMYMFMKRLS